MDKPGRLAHGPWSMAHRNLHTEWGLLIRWSAVRHLEFSESATEKGTGNDEQSNREPGCGDRRRGNGDRSAGYPSGPTPAKPPPPPPAFVSRHQPQNRMGKSFGDSWLPSLRDAPLSVVDRIGAEVEEPSMRMGTGRASRNT